MDKVFTSINNLIDFKIKEYYKERDKALIECLAEVGIEYVFVEEASKLLEEKDYRINVVEIGFKTYIHIINSNDDIIAQRTVICMEG